MSALSGQLRLDFRSDEPITQQLVRQIEALVAQGALKPGDQLPTVRELAIELRINFSTVARAYRILDEKRLISTQRGRGTYIWDSQDPPDNDRRAARLETLARHYVQEALAIGATREQVLQAVAEAAQAAAA